MAALGQDASGRSSRLTTRQDQIELFGEACELSAPAVRFGLQGGRSGGALLVLSRFEQRPRLSVPPRLFANSYFAATVLFCTTATPATAVASGVALALIPSRQPLMFAFNAA